MGFFFDFQLADLFNGCGWKLKFIIYISCAKSTILIESRGYLKLTANRYETFLSILIFLKTVVGLSQVPNAIHASYKFNIILTISPDLYVGP